MYHQAADHLLLEGATDSSSGPFELQDDNAALAEVILISASGSLGTLKVMPEISDDGMNWSPTSGSSVVFTSSDDPPARGTVTLTGLTSRYIRLRFSNTTSNVLLNAAINTKRV